MKRALMLMFLVLLVATTLYADHIYYNGKITDVSKNSLKVDGKVYWIATDCTTAIHYEVKGAFFEEPASLSDVKVGDWVTIKVEGETVHEILIERYRK